MTTISVTVKLAGQARLHDTLLDDAAQLSDVAATLADCHGWRGGEKDAVRYIVEAYPPGTLLPPDTTLAAAGVSDGCWLVFHPVAPPSDVSNHISWPVSGWRPIPEPPPHWNNTGLPPIGDIVFPWRHIDHDPD